MECNKPFPMAFLSCEGCGAQGPTGKSLEHAILLWNRRRSWKVGDKMTKLIYGTTLSLFLGAVPSFAATLQDLDNTIAALNTIADTETEQGMAVVDAIQRVTAPPQTLTVGSAKIQRSSATDLTIHYKASTATVSAMQFDFVVPQGFMVQSVTAGLAAQAAGKSVQANPVATGQRILVFGLNQTVIPSGPVAVIRLQANFSAPVGMTNLTAVVVSASNPSGGNVPLAIRNGKVNVL